MQVFGLGRASLPSDRQLTDHLLANRCQITLLIDVLVYICLVVPNINHIDQSRLAFPGYYDFFELLEDVGCSDGCISLPVCRTAILILLHIIYHHVILRQLKPVGGRIDRLFRLCSRREVVLQGFLFVLVRVPRSGSY